jgi:hypothetical protein
MLEICYIVIDSSTIHLMNFLLEESEIFLIFEFFVANAIFLGKALGYLSSKASVMRDFFLDIHQTPRLIECTTSLRDLLERLMMCNLMQLWDLKMKRKT